VRLVALVVVVLAVSVVRAAEPSDVHATDGVKATLTTAVRSHGQPPPTSIGIVAIAAGLVAASAWVGSTSFVAVEVRRRTVSPIRRRGPPPVD
jgi:hypothetical protein